MAYRESAELKNLDENAISPPLSRREHRHSDAYLEQEPGNRNHHDEEIRLSELAFSPPARESSKTSTNDIETLEDKECVPDEESFGSSSWNNKEPENLEDSRRQAASEPQISPPQKISKPLTDIYILSYLILFSILGTLARLGIQWITFYPSAVVTTPVLWANVGGSIIMGFLAEDQQLFRNSFAGEPDRKQTGKMKKKIPLYVGLATGFCGSLTSFSSFMRDAFLAISNDLPATMVLEHRNGIARHGGYSLEAFMAVLVTTVGLSLGGLFFGAHFALLLDPIMPTFPLSRKKWYGIDQAALFLGWGCWAGAIFVAIWPPHETWRGEAVFALVFAPIGCLLRFYTSIKLNGWKSSFPLGTFVVNVVGTAFEGMCYDLQHVSTRHVPSVMTQRMGCQVLQGVQDGFCGCLTTVSTWIAELDGLKRKQSYFYGATTVVSGITLMIAIMGSVKWSIGWIDPVCDTGYSKKY